MMDNYIKIDEENKEITNFNIITEFISYYAEKNGNKTAIRDDDRTISYRELEARLDAFAYFLEKLGLEKGARIAIYLKNSIDYANTIFAAFKKSCLYVPLPYNDPKERILEIMNDCQPAVLVTQKKDGIYELIDPAYTRFVIFTDETEEISGIEEQNQNFAGVSFYSFAHCLLERKVISNPNRDPKSLAYIIYTSGSTGRPKGVTIRHESYMNYVKEAVIAFDYDENTNAMSESPYHFDGSFSALYAPIYTGGTNVIFNNRLMLPREFLNRLITYQVTHLSCVPSFFNVMADNIKEELAPGIRLKTVALGGEDCQDSYIRKFKQLLPNTKIFNQYGPTETCDVVCGFEITLEFIEQNKKVPIGKPYKNVNLYAFKENNELIKPGEVGELYIGGIQVMEGYWNDLLLTQGKLKGDIVTGELLFKTGDLVTINEEGDYIFVDRKDNMINKYGNRIYLSEIENALSALDSVKEVVCLFIQAQGASDIIAFVVLNRDISEQELREVLKKKLPDFMIPNAIKIMEAIYYLSNGKVDRKKLESLYLSSKKSPAAISNSTGYSDRLANIITSLALCSDVVLDENVNLVETLGFDSMMLLRLIMEIENEFNIQFTRDEIHLENFITICQILNVLKTKC